MKAIQVMSALAQPTRLEVFGELAKAGAAGLSAGVIADRMGTPANTLSAHLAILSRAGLVTSTRDGRSIIYRAEGQAMRGLVTFLVSECCDGNPDRCKDILDGVRRELSAAGQAKD